ncbi:MAG: P-II family nitrogen regulator [Desulfarculales bacterium]|jgi:nitrogen regulatory protein P-II 1|nr:P-II family nitrogen regulator [Desulfarculales bacterium]
MKKIEAIVRHAKLNQITDALLTNGIKGMNMTDIKGFGRQLGHNDLHGKQEVRAPIYLPMVKLEIVLDAQLVDKAIAIIQKNAFTGQVGDGKIFVSAVENVVRIRTNQSGKEAI